MDKPVYFLEHIWQFYVLSIVFPPFFIIVILLRKQLFAKILIDEHGIKMFYRKVATRQIEWKEIQGAQAMLANEVQIFFAKDRDILSTQKKRLERAKEMFIVRLGAKAQAQALYQYKDKIPVSIRDLDKLPKRAKHIQEKLQ